MANKVPLPVPQPAVNFVKLLVVKDLRVGEVIYTARHEIEVFHHEAIALLRDYPDCFEVV